MSTDKTPEENEIFTDEAANAARTRLRECLAKEDMRRDAARMDGNQSAEGEASDSEAEPEDERELVYEVDDDFEEDIDNLFPFKSAERQLIERLERTIRQHMRMAEPASLREIAAFLHALQRLPYATRDLSLDLALMTRLEENLSWVSVELDGQAFRLSTGGSAYSPEVGSDSYSSTLFQIELGGFRDGTTQDFEDWLDAFVSEGGVIQIQGDGDTDLTDPAPDDGWARLDRYWEHRWEEEDDH